MPTENRYENWHSGVCYATIMSGCVIRWKHLKLPYEISASRNGVTGDLPVMAIEQLDETIELLSEARSVHAALSGDHGTGKANRRAIEAIYPQAPWASDGKTPCPCARCAEEREGQADDAAAGG